MRTDPNNHGMGRLVQLCKVQVHAAWNMESQDHRPSFISRLSRFPHTQVLWAVGPPGVGKEEGVPSGVKRCQTRGRHTSPVSSSRTVGSY